MANPESSPRKGPQSLKALAMLLGLQKQLMETCSQWEVGQGAHTALGSPALKVSVTRLLGENLPQGN